MQQAHGAGQLDFGCVNACHFVANAAQNAFRRPVPRALCAVTAAVDDPIVLCRQIFDFTLARPMARHIHRLQSIGKRIQYLPSVQLPFRRQIQAV